MKRILAKARGFLSGSRFSSLNPLNRRRSPERRIKNANVNEAGRVETDTESYLALKNPKPLKGKMSGGTVSFKDRRSTMRGAHDVAFLEKHPDRRAPRK